MAIHGLLAESPLQTCLCGERLQVEDRQRTPDVILAVVAVRGFPVLDGLAPRCNIAPKVIREAEFACFSPELQILVSTTNPTLS